jgi:hypothetical protein
MELSLFSIIFYLSFKKFICHPSSSHSLSLKKLSSSLPGVQLSRIGAVSLPVLLSTILTSLIALNANLILYLSTSCRPSISAKARIFITCIPALCINLYLLWVPTQIHLDHHSITTPSMNPKK